MRRPLDVAKGAKGAVPGSSRREAREPMMHPERGPARTLTCSREAREQNVVLVNQRLGDLLPAAFRCNALAAGALGPALNAFPPGLPLVRSKAPPPVRIRRARCRTCGRRIDREGGKVRLLRLRRRPA